MLEAPGHRTEGSSAKWLSAGRGPEHFTGTTAQDSGRIGLDAFWQTLASKFRNSVETYEFACPYRQE
jgi:hypothetical protein